MGNSSISRQFKSGNWKRIERGVNREVLQNVQTKMKVEKYYARSDFQSFDDRYQNTQLYNWRKSLDQRVNIVKMYEFQIKEEMFGIQQEQFVYTEKINRFDQKGRPYSRAEGFLLIMDFLKGFITLVGVFGYFNIDIFLLGVSEDGKGKVWINENFAKNQIEEKNIIEQPSPNTEITLVNNLIRLVSDKVYNEDFMSEVPYPWNMNMQQAIDYIKAVRNENVLFKVQKVYWDRSEFRQEIQILQQKFEQITRNKQSSYQSVKSPNKNSPVKGGREQNNRVQSEKHHQQVVKHKKDPSETLSSDSNSRSRTNQLLFAANEDGVNNRGVRMQQRFAGDFNENQPIKQIFTENYQPPQVLIPYETNIHTHPIMENPTYFTQQQQLQYLHQLPIPSHEMQRPYHQMQKHHEIQRPSNHEIQRPSHHEMQRPSHEITRPSFSQERNPTFQPRPTRQIKQKIIEPSAQSLENRPQYIERKVVKYRTLNQTQMEQQLRNPQSFNKLALRNNIPPPQFLPITPKHIEPTYFPYQNQSTPPQWIKPMVPLQKPNRQIVPEEPKQIDYYMMTQSQKLINNVELCESVLLDQGELLSNLRDLEN